MRTCFRCKQSKPLSEIYRSNVRYYQRECKACTKQRQHRWFRTEEGRRSSANTKLKRRFGITLDEFNEKLLKQGSCCLICGASHSVNGHRLAVDHNHETGENRGLLCKSCNVAIGHLKDNPMLCLKAAEYLQSYRKERPDVVDCC